MNDTIKTSIIFVAGVASGVLISFKYFDKKYKKISDNEIAELDKYYKNRFNIKEEPVVKKVEPIEEEYIESDAELIQKYSGKSINQIKKDLSGEAPYMISPEEFDQSDNEGINLVLHSDGCIENDNGDLVDDDELVSAIKTTAEDSGDVFYIHYAKTGCDYEISKDNEPYYY